jgi:hypothetical protein
MATRRYKVSPGENEFQVTEEVGVATNSDAFELTIDFANTRVNNTVGTRSVTKEEALQALDKFKNHIIRSNWFRE